MNILKMEVFLGNERYTYRFKKSNLIFSKENSVGKTTLIRMLLYSLGFSIPSTRKLNMRNLVFRTKVLRDDNVNITITRKAKKVLICMFGKTTEFDIKHQKREVIALIFNFSNSNNLQICNNLLGAFYIDQDKGWTLLNRGNPIGKEERFNIKEFLNGFTDLNFGKEEGEVLLLKQSKAKYANLKEAKEIFENVNVVKRKIDLSGFSEKLNKDLSILNLEKNDIESDIDDINSIMSNNEQSRKTIIDMNLMIKTEIGPVMVDENNLIGFEYTQELLESNLSVLNIKHNKVIQKINSIENEMDNQELIKTEEITGVIGKMIDNLNISHLSMENTINVIESKIKSLNNQIESISNVNSKYVKVKSKLFKYIRKFAIEDMKLDEKFISEKNFIFTSKISRLSGRNYAQLAFAFRMGYVKIISEFFGIKLPIIVDSPYSVELSKDNVYNMFKIVKREFSNHFVLFSSIHNDFNFTFEKIIELQDKALDEKRMDILENLISI